MMTDAETQILLGESQLKALNGGVPSDTFAAYDYDWAGVTEWITGQIREHAQWFVDRLNEDPAQCIAAVFAEGLAIGIQAERTRREEI